MAQDFRFDDFTEESYSNVLALAADYWAFSSFGTVSSAPHVLWRHDVDVSPNRALRLAQIEHERGLKATYFFSLHSEFYNCMDRHVRQIIRRIVDYGHDIGVHFEVSFYSDIENVTTLEGRLAREAEIIAGLANSEPTAVSFHNPTKEQLSRYGQPRLGGLANAYGSSLRNSHKYISDSNGYWRFDRLQDVLAERAEPALHVLTHPEWWTPDCRSPRDRILRAVEGRAERLMREYDAFLALHGRENVG